MTVIKRILGYEFKFSVACVLIVTVFVLAMNLIWQNAPLWIFLIFGVLYGTAEDPVRRYTARRAASRARHRSFTGQPPSTR